MTHIDLTSVLDRKKRDRKVETTVYWNGKYFGFASSQGRLSTGIAFLRTTYKGVYAHRNGITKWYFGDFNSLYEAVSRARKRYGIKFPTTGWKKFRVKHFNTTTPQEIVQQIQAA